MTVRKTVWRLAGTISLAALLAGGVLAQPPAQGGNGQGQGRRQGGRRQSPMVAALATLNLTADQQARVKTVTDKNQADSRALRQDQSLSPQQRREKSRELNRKMTDDINAILTPEQQTKLKQEMRTRQAGGALNGMLRQLNLTAEQRAKIDPIVKDATEALAKAREDQSLDARARREKTQAVTRETVAKIRALLTTEQQTKLDELVQQQGRRQGGGNRNRPNGNS